MKEEIQIAKIATEVEATYQMGGLSSGVYFDFAREVAVRYADWKIKECLPSECCNHDGEEFALGYNTCREHFLSNKDKK